MLWLNKQVSIGLLRFSRSLASLANTPSHTKRFILNTQQCITQSAHINLDTNDYIGGLSYYLFAFNLDRCMGR